MYDAMGNVHGLINSGTGAVMAAYEYDAFGNTLRESGSYAASNPFRYSTKYTDIETGLIYYGHRYYSPSLGRFINKDPIQEMGGLNLYSFCRNNGVNRWDYLGMSDSADTSWRDWHNDTLQLAPITVGRGDTDHGEAIMTQAGEGDLMAQANASMAAVRIIALGNSSQNFTRSGSGGGLSGQDANGNGGTAVPLDPFVVKEKGPNSAANIPTIGPAGPSKPPSPPGGFEAFVGLDGDLVGILGLEGAAGIVVNFKNFSQSGVYGSIGPAAGANVGLSVNAGFARRGVSGWSGNIDANVGAVSPTVSFDADGFNGLALGYGPGAGLSVSATNTGKYTFSDFGSDVKRAWNRLFGPGP